MKKSVLAFGFSLSLLAPRGLPGSRAAELRFLMPPRRWFNVSEAPKPFAFVSRRDKTETKQKIFALPFYFYTLVIFLFGIRWEFVAQKLVFLLFSAIIYTLGTKRAVFIIITFVSSSFLGRRRLAAAKLRPSSTYSSK